MGHNRTVASMLRQIAVLLAEQGEAFKPAAYRRAAQVLEELPRDVSTFADEKELMELPGIGKAIAAKIVQYLKTGRMQALDELLAAQGGIPPALMDIENLGPKRARQIVQALGISTVEDLVAAARAGKLRSLPRMSELMEKKILESALRVEERRKRFPRGEVERAVEALLAAVRTVPGVQRAEAAGSYRRNKETVGDIDLLVVTPSPAAVSRAISRLPFVRNIVAQGNKKLSFDLRASPASAREVWHIRTDIRFVKRSQWGAALLYFTGSKEHNIALRKIAIRKGWKLNEYGLFEGEKIVASREEKDIYRALGLAYRAPWERTEEVNSQH